VEEGVLLPLGLVPRLLELVLRGLEALDCTGQELLVRLLQAVLPAALQEAVALEF
jgi:hypothetical protein